MKRPKSQLLSSQASLIEQDGWVFERRDQMHSFCVDVCGLLAQFVDDKLAHRGPQPAQLDQRVSRSTSSPFSIVQSAPRPSLALVTAAQRSRDCDFFHGSST